MLTSPLTVLSTSCLSVVFANSPSHSLSIRHPPVVYVNSPSHSLNIRHPPVVYVNRLLTKTTDRQLVLKTVRGAVNINYLWMPYA
jgi:hypothetical protein